MPTKAELIAFASEVGVDVSEAWTKGDIEASLANAGYDPDTLNEGEDVSTDDTTTTAPDGADGDPNEIGYAGVVFDEIENEAYTVQGQGKETARREREQTHRLRAARLDLNDEEAE
jgi:hypothetical protein